MSSLLRYAFLCLFLILLFSCQEEKNPRKYRIGFSQCTGLDAWRRQMLMSMRGELVFYPEIELLYRDAENSSERQIGDIEYFIDSKVDLLIVSPNETDPITPVVERAFQSGIPVIMVDRKINSSMYNAYIGANNHEIGGFTSGNAIEHPEYHGENLARLGDIVFCSINHRLGPLGFANFAGVGGEKFAASGNVGMLDIVAALEWVRDNVSNFGGDPNNVTIMGQSGGGAKVCTLMAMPSAKGLFHKAVALSGSSLKAGEKVDSEKLGTYILKEANLSASAIDKLQTLPWKDYLVLANNANRKLREDSGLPATGGPGIGGFRPVVDGFYLPQHPYFPEASPHSGNVPMMICTTFYERSPSSFDSSMENITKEQAKEHLKTMRGFGSSIGENASAVYDAYEKTFTDRKPIEILSMAISNRRNAVALADAKSKQAAPVYMAWFGWNPPLFDGRLRAFHTLDICFWFNNTDRQLSHSGGGARPRKLATKMAGSLLQFMKTGNPNVPGLPSWPKYSAANGETMVLNDVLSVHNDPDREARKSLPAI